MEQGSFKEGAVRFKVYETGFFKKLDTVLYYAGEFLLGFLFFYPVITVAKGVLSDPEARHSALGNFLSFSPEIVLLALFMAFVYVVVFSGLHFKYIFALCVVVFVSVSAVVLGQGYWMIFAGPAAAVLLFWIVSRKVAALQNFFVDAFNFYVKSLMPDDGGQEAFDTIFSEGLAVEKKNRHFIPQKVRRQAKSVLNRMLALLMAVIFVAALAALSFGGLILFMKLTKKTWGP